MFVLLRGSRIEFNFVFRDDLCLKYYKLIAQKGPSSWQCGWVRKQVLESEANATEVFEALFPNDGSILTSSYLISTSGMPIPLPHPSPPKVLALS